MKPIPLNPSRRKPVALRLLAAAVAALVISGSALATGEHDHSAHQHAAPARGESQAMRAHYSVPAVNLVRQDGKIVSLQDELKGDSPVILAFIYTSCTAVCPMTSQIMSQVQDRLGSRRRNVKLVSISIDPEQDTPVRLREYAASLEAGPQWAHYTGTRKASVVAQKAFGAFYGDKMNHRPAIFVRAGAGDAWTRLEGFPVPSKVIEALRETAGA